EGVVDHVAVIPRDVAAAPDGVEDLEIGVHDHAQGGLRLDVVRQDPCSNEQHQKERTQELHAGPLSNPPCSRRKARPRRPSSTDSSITPGSLAKAGWLATEMIPIPIVPAPGTAWRSRCAPHGSWQSFRWKATTRSSMPSSENASARRWPESPPDRSK